MLNMFSTREIASSLWIMGFLCFIFIYPKTRKSAINVVKTACSRQLIIPFVLLLIYAAVLILIFSFSPIWKCLYLKDITIWVLFAGVPLCFGSVKRNGNKNYFINIIRDNIKFTILIEFFISSFTFNIIVEIVMLPVLAILFMFDAVADNKEEYKLVKKFMSGFLAFIGLVILAFTLRNAITSLSTLGGLDLLISFFIPLVFSILYLPFMFIFAICAEYQMLFIRMSFYELKEMRTQSKHRWNVIKACGISYKNILLFEKEFIPKLNRDMSENEFEEMINLFEVVKK